MRVIYANNLSKWRVYTFMSRTKSAVLLFVFAAALSLAGCSSPGQKEVNSARPESLPEDLPIPDGASITSSSTSGKQGKKSAFLIYETQRSMEEIGSVYQQYIKEKHLPQDTNIVDRHNVLIHGTAEGTYTFSIIGSELSSKPGTVEVILGWVYD